MFGFRVSFAGSFVVCSFFSRVDSRVGVEEGGFLVVGVFFLDVGVVGVLWVFFMFEGSGRRWGFLFGGCTVVFV